MPERANRSTLTLPSCSNLAETTLPVPLNRTAEVKEIQKAWIREENPWYLLPGTGFNVRLQVDRFEADMRLGINQARPIDEVFEESFQKIEQDIQAFKVEYLCEGLLFPIVLDKDIVEEQERVVPAIYGHKSPYIETVSDKERCGAVRKSIEAVEEFLLSAPPGSIAVMTSPDGWSGFEGITYQDTQTYIWRVMENGKPKGFTIRTDMTLDQNRKLLLYFGKNMPEAADVKGQIIDTVSSPVFIRAEDGQAAWQFEDAVNIIRKVKGSNTAYKEKPFSEIYEQLKDPESLWTLDETTLKLTDHLKSSLKGKVGNGKYNRQEFEVTLGTTVLDLAKQIRNPKITNYQEEIPVDTIDYVPQTINIPPNYIQVLAEVQGLPGCNGGGTAFTNSFIFQNTLSPRYAESSLGEDQYGTLMIHCEEEGCGATYQRTPGTLEKNCRNCGGTKGIVC